MFHHEVNLWSQFRDPVPPRGHQPVPLVDERSDRPGNPIALNRNGYLYLTATADGAVALEASARRLATAGVGELRIHDRGREPAWSAPRWDRREPTADGADLFLDPAAIRRLFPWAAPDVRAALHARRCGWLAAQQLGMQWLEEARAAGARLVEGTLVDVELAGGQVAGVAISRGRRIERVATPVVIDAAGPFAGDVARLAGLELPLFQELHRKVFFDDELGAIPREAPLVIWNDPVTLDWSAEERAALAEDPETTLLAGEIPAGVHFRPEGGAGSRSALLLWNYHVAPVDRRFPLPEDPLHVPVVVRGVARALPAFAPYAERGRKPYVDGGYYTKTRENRPLLGPAGPPGFHLACALSGFGIMAAPAAGELVAAGILGDPLPAWSAAFRLARYANPAYLASLARLEAGQL
jgi:sarcosine oxidase, subunit beta